MNKKIEVSKKELKPRSKLFSGWLVVIAFIFLILTYFSKQTPYFNFDLHITLAIQRFNLIWFDFLMRFITNLGYYPLSVLSIGFIAIFLFLVSKKIEAFLLIFSGIGVTVLSEIVKNLVSRERPNPELVHQVVAHLRADSFPSGHVLLFIGIYGFIFYLSFTHFKNSLLRIISCAFSLTLIILVGLSRIYLGEHWFSDVFGAYLLGILWLYFLITIYHKLNKL